MVGNQGISKKTDDRLSYGNIDGSCLSPKYFHIHRLVGHQTGFSWYKYNLRRHVIEKRLQHLRISWRHLVPFVPSNSAGIYSMDIDPVEQRYLLCGACNGSVTIVEMENEKLNDGTTEVEHKVIANGLTSRRRSYLISCCQWYPQDTSAFVTSTVDKIVKVWDTNRMEVVDEFPFLCEISEVHWSAGLFGSSRIAVADNTSNIALIDPRSGDAMQHLRWRGEKATTVRWSPERSYYLLSGGANGNIALWDVRSARSRLMVLKSSDDIVSPISGIRFTSDGLYVVSLNAAKTFEIWRAHTLESIRLTTASAVSCEGDTYSLASRFGIIANGTVLRACIPAGNNVVIKELEGNCLQKELVGHFHRVNACVYRESHNQVISSSNDRMILMWCPDMDERMPDATSEMVSKLYKDTWSDED